MVRSKFPGKPSKIVNRKVVKASKCSVLHDNESSKAAQNISYGLAVFNETFGDHEQVLTAFHGFSPHEVDNAREIANDQQEKVLEEYQTSGSNFSTDDAIPVKLDPPTPQDLSYVAANLALIGAVGGHTTRAQCLNLQSESKGNDLAKSTSPSKFFSPAKPSFKKHVASRLLHKAKKVNVDVLSSRMSPNSLLEKKFVLPCRSARSSRVIKPNKRFLEPEGGQEDPPSPTSLTGQPSHVTRVIELKKPRLILDKVDFSMQVSDKEKLCERKTSNDPGLSKPNKSKGHVKFAELNVFGAPTSRPHRRTSQSSEGSPKKSCLVASSSSSEVAKPAQVPDAVSPSRSKLILRESKLNISASGSANEEQLSVKPKKGLDPKVVKSPGVSVECGVCGAVRFHRLTKQSLKFGLICCEPCRKFIAKMMLRSKSSENSVPCDNGQGNCAVSSPLNGESFATKVNRCGACWLLLCVQRLAKMPDQIRDSLIRMLPANMQGMTVVLPVAMVNYVPSQKNRKGRKGTVMQDGTEDTSSSPQRSPKVSCGQPTPTSGRKLSASSSNKIIGQTPIARIKRKAALVSLANNLKRVRDKTFSPITPPGATKKSIRSEKPLKMRKLHPAKKSDLKNTEKPLRKGNNKNAVKLKDGQMRQKLTLKGPRVKHVCRSASIVLGQPLATFPNSSPTSSPLKSSESSFDSHKISELTVSVLMDSDVLDKAPRLKQVHHKEIKNKKESKPGAVVEVDDSKDLVLKTSVSQLPLVPSATLDAKLVSKITLEQRGYQNQNVGRKITRLPSMVQHQGKMIQRGQRRTLQDLGVYTNQAENLPELVSLDFWESYDPDEVCYAGFGLIGFDPFHAKPVCFLCGSAGTKKLIHCASCCEPYHQFCVEMGALGGSGPLPLVEQSSKEVWRVDWVCPRCTVCHGCGYNSGRQLAACQRCHHSFHLECLGTTGLRKSAGDRLWICASCLRCKSCNSTDVSKFVGNLPFCKVCFKLRQKGNFCPLCQGCYTDDDFQSKMMECAACKSWVHAKCEGLSDEKYQVLSALPESVEYICRLCCAAPPAPWWVAVEAELQAGFGNIIKAITKNRKAYAMLKWSPQKACSCHHQPSSCSKSSALALGKRRLSFNPKGSKEANSISPVSSEASQTSTGMVKEGEVSSVFEFDEDLDAGENAPITKYSHSKDKFKIEGCHKELHLDCGNDEKPIKSSQFSPNAGSQSDSGVGSTDDELKTCSATEEEEVEESKPVVDMIVECTCMMQSSRPSFPTLLTVKKKVQSNEYSSILEFHRDMDQLIREADSHEIKELYHQTLLEVFPWFDPKYDKVSRNSFQLSPLKAHHGSRLQYQPNSATPEKQHPDHASSVRMLERLLPKETSKLDDDYFYFGTKSEDTRVCGFCKLTGDSDACAEGRLLYCGLNEWVHVNCALWSAEVFEEIDGALQNVSNALSRGRMIRCSQCGRKGASVGCCAKKCEETLHFPCARSAGFVFMEDKNAFCSLHSRDAPGKPLVKPSDFDVCRPVFVELDRRKKKSVESKHVRLMIGSLLVQSLGTIVPELSDLGSSLVPTLFNCTRLFWSSKEPWRIVRYTIRTTIRLPAPEPVVDLGHHVTVDHSKDTVNSSSMSEPAENMDIKAEISSIHQNPRKERDINMRKALTDDAKIAEAVVNHLLDSICSRETDEEVTDAQNSADLLPPELKDAIFEDLPHDLLDGISMQDIFQDKFLNFEELSKEDSQDDCSSNGAAISEADKQKIRNFKASRELKRSQSDVLPGNSSYVDSRLHQRSCSLAWSYKLGTNISCCKTQKVSAAEGVDRTKLIQELRLSVKPAPTELRFPGPGDKGKENQSLAWPRIMQVDGVSDAFLSGSDEGSDLEATDLVPRFSLKNSSDKFSSNLIKDSELLRNRIECLKTVTSAALIRKGSEFVHQDSRTKRRKSIKRTTVERRYVSEMPRTLFIPQLDGTNDVSSDSEQEGSSIKQLQEQCDEKPVRCNRCGCTYRTEESHARHLPSCSGDYSLTTSESEAEITEDEAEGVVKMVSSPSPDSAISVSSGSLSVGASASPTTLPPVSPPVPSVVPTIVPPVITTAAPTVIKTELQSSKSQSGKTFVVKSIQPHVQAVRRPVQGPVTSTSNKVQKTSATKSKVMKTSSQQQLVKLMMKGNQSVLHHQQVFKQSNHQQISQQTLPRSLPTSIAPQPSQIITMMDYQQSQQSAPTVLVQSVPSQAMIPSYLEAFQQHTGQNLQYLTTVDTNQGFGKTQYLTAVPSSVVPGAYQIQAMPDGQLCLEPSTVGIPTISGIQLAQAQLPQAQIPQAQPQVLGTILQSPLSCGVMAAPEPIYETIQMFPDQSGGVLLASQPMLTCMETVVSNTYMSMSSSQFVSSSVPGMLQGSSTFSTTTTQVFQASKVDPPVLDVPTQYVVLNTHPQLPDAAVGKLEVMSLPQPHIQEQRSIQSQAQIHVPSINLPVPVTVTAPLPPQTLPPVIPTSVVTPMPRVQPQRTYSKPSKGVKETVVAVVKKPVPQVSCSAVKENFKKMSNQDVSKPVKEVTPPAKTGPFQVEIKKEVKLVEATIKKPAPPEAPKVANPLPSPVPATQPASEIISSITAPAQSITLPDPVKLTPPIINGPKVLSVPVPTASAKCPPVTFSYRAHAVEKGKPKPNMATPPASTVVVPVSLPSINQDAKAHPVKQANNSLNSIPVNVLPAPIPTITSKPLPVFNCVDEPQTDSSTSMKKPTAAVIPQSVVEKQDLKKPQNIKIVSVNTPVSAMMPVKVSSAHNVKLAVPTVSTVSLAKSSNSTTSNPAVSDSSQSQVGKNVSISLMTASITDSTTSTATSVTASSQSTVPRTTTKLQGVNNNVACLKPLKEINQVKQNLEVKPVVQKAQEKEVSSIPPSVLKSTSQNIDAAKKCEAFCAQGDLPLGPANADISNTSLKLLFQKQPHNGCYKVSSSPGKKDNELMAVKLADINIVSSVLKERRVIKDENMKPVEKVLKKSGPPVPEILYEIHCPDGFSYSSTSITDAWQKVFGAVQEARSNHKMPPLIHNPFNSIETGHNVMGLGNNSLKYLLEQLPGVGNCTKYRPVYHKSRLPGPGYQYKREDHDLKESNSGCARTDPYLSAKKYDMFSWLDSRHRRPPKLLNNNDIDALTGSRRTASTSLPMAMRFRHLRDTSKTSVGVFRSDIHGRGLFCLRDIEAGEMVIEYAGEVIRNTLTDNREKYYQSKGIGCYMFKVDDNFTVDATLKGNAARFINHSCEPNCYSRVVDILGKKHIIIFAFRRIPQGEELTYDYKFPIEEEKIHCHCLARRCRKYLN